jgi:subtilase family serine protease
MLLDKRAEGPADLVALPIPASTPPFGFCRRNDQGQLLIDVYNQGGTGADASTTRVIFENVGVTDIATPALDPRSRTQLAVAIPDACFDANNECRFALGVDAMNAVAESSETNNDVAGACGPQFQ